MKLENRTQLTLLREQCQEKRNKETCKILVCGGTGCLAGGSDKIFDRFSELTAGMDHVEVRIGAEIAHGEHVGVKKSGCHGFCEMGPLVRIEPYNYLYLKVKLEDCEEIFEKTVLHGEPVTIARSTTAMRQILSLFLAFSNCSCTFFTPVLHFLSP